MPFLGHIVGRRGLECDPKKIEDVKAWPIPDCLRSVRQFLGFVGYYRRFVPGFADLAEPLVALTGKDVPFVWRPACTMAFVSLRDVLVRAPVLAFPTETGPYILDTDASNFGLGGVLSQIQNDVECVIAYCSRALRPSQRKYCTTICVALSLLYVPTIIKSIVWLHRFKDTEGMMAHWLHTLQQFQFSIVHRAGCDHGNADGLSRVPTSPCGQCARVDCPPVDTAILRWWINRSTWSLLVTRRTPISFPFSPVRIGWLSLMMICPDRPPSPVRTFALLPFSFRILLASHS